MVTDFWHLLCSLNYVLEEKAAQATGSERKNSRSSYLKCLTQAFHELTNAVLFRQIVGFVNEGR